MSLLATTPAVAPQARPSHWRQAARSLMAATLPRRLFITHNHVQSRTVSLTFDDGPHPEYTPRVLDILSALRVPATFFIVGAHARELPELVRRIHAEGHEIGNHSYSHADPRTLSARSLAKEVRLTQQLLINQTGTRTQLFRPPHGKLTAGKLLRLWLSGSQIVLWNNDPKDFACQSAEELADKLRQHPPQAGDIVLLHDTAVHTPAVLPGLVQSIRAAGLSFSTISQSMKGKA